MANPNQNSPIDAMFAALDQLWDGLTSPNANLNDLPHQIHAGLSDLYFKVTQGGQLPPLPDLTAMLPTPTPPPPPPAPSRVACVKSHINPYLLAFVTTGAVAGGTYYYYPAAFHRHIVPVFRPLQQFVPVALLPEPNRPARVLSSNQAEIRKEVALVLGADGVARELALDLERRGFCVIATVRNPQDVDVLEKRGRGWIKVLVLDPAESSSVAPFLRSLSTALSLRFPLHASGDPFSRPTHSLALTAVINCLSLYPQADGLRPVEALAPEQVRQSLGDRVATVVGVLGGILPILRSAAGRPGAPEGVVLSLMPARSSNISMPFFALQSAADHAIMSIIDSLRRELTASRTSNVRVAVLETGLFDLPSGSSALARPDLESQPLPVRLESVYAPALARRHYATVSREARRVRKGSQPRKLHKKVFEMIVYGRGGTKSRVGVGAFTYRFFAALPTYFIDSALSLNDRLIARFIAHRPIVPLLRPSPPRLGSSEDGSYRSQSNPAASRSSLAASQVSAADSFAAASHHGEHESDSGSDNGTSSIEDFGVASGMGSFIGVERHEGQSS